MPLTSFAGGNVGEAELIPRHELLPLLGTVHKEGENIFAYCPVHNDGQKSQGKGGRAGRSLILYKSGILQCAAGCKTTDVLDALQAREPKQQAPMGGPVAVYEYRDVHGTPVAVKGRFENPDGKTFRWRLPEGTFKEGLGDLSIKDIPLWDIDYIMAEPGRVWICEGEKATEAVRARGELATCGPWGSSQRDFGEAFLPLRGRDILLWPDNDEPGREYMTAVARHLREHGIANKLATISAPVPPKGDAHEYFSAGGSIDALLEGILFRPTVDVLASDHLKVRVPVETGVAVFDFADIQRNNRALQSEMHIWLGESEPYAQEINLQSQSTREGLVRQLNNLYGKDVNWTAAVNTAYSKMRSTLKEVQTHEAELLAGSQERIPTEMVLDPFIIDGGGTVLFGPPKRGKSWTALLMAISIDAGVSECWRIPRPRHVLYVNLERPPKTLANRISSVNEALGLPLERPLRTINARGKSLVDVMDAIRAAIETHGVEMIVLDSMSRSGLGDLNDNETGNRIMDMLNSLGITWLAIGHSPRGDETHLFGSVMQDAAADVMVGIMAEQRTEANVLGVGLRATQANDIPTPPMEMWAYHMDAAGLVAVRRAKQNEFVEMEANKPTTLRSKVRDYVSEVGASTATEVAQELDEDVSNVSKILRGPGFTLVAQEGRSKKYGVAAEDGGNHGSHQLPDGDIGGGNTPPIGTTITNISDLGPCERCKRPGAEHMSGVDGTPRCLACFDEEMNR